MANYGSLFADRHPSVDGQDHSTMVIPAWLSTDGHPSVNFQGWPSLHSLFMERHPWRGIQGRIHQGWSCIDVPTMDCLSNGNPCLAHRYMTIRSGCIIGSYSMDGTPWITIHMIGAMAIHGRPRWDGYPWMAMLGWRWSDAFLGHRRSNGYLRMAFHAWPSVDCGSCSCRPKCVLEIEIDQILVLGYTSLYPKAHFQLPHFAKKASVDALCTAIEICFHFHGHRKLSERKCTF